MFPMTALQWVKYLAIALDGWSVSKSEVLAAERSVKVLQAQFQKGRPGGQECVFESLMRCRLTAQIMSSFATDKNSLPKILNSSHTVPRHVCIDNTRHDHLISNEGWRSGFTEAINKYGDLIDIPVPGRRNPARADLYLFASDGIVSLELKYIGPGRPIGAPLAQMRRYRKHKHSFLVVYAALPCAADLEEQMSEVEKQLRQQPMSGLVVRGPKIARVEAS